MYNLLHLGVLAKPHIFVQNGDTLDKSMISAGRVLLLLLHKIRIKEKFKKKVNKCIYFSHIYKFSRA